MRAGPPANSFPLKEAEPQVPPPFVSFCPDGPLPGRCSAWRRTAGRAWKHPASPKRPGRRFPGPQTFGAGPAPVSHCAASRAAPWGKFPGMLCLFGKAPGPWDKPLAGRPLPSGLQVPGRCFPDKANAPTLFSLKKSGVRETFPDSGHSFSPSSPDKTASWPPGPGSPGPGAASSRRSRQ